MAGTVFFGAVRSVQRVAWWVFVVTALMAGGVAWWPWRQTSTVQYRGSYGVTTFEPLGTALVSGVGADGPRWAGPVTLIAAALVVAAAASVSTVVRSSNWEGAVVALVGAALAIGTVAVAVNGSGGNSFSPAIVVVLVVLAAAVHEAAMHVSAPARQNPNTL